MKNTLRIRVVPRSKTNSVEKFGDGLKVRITTPPVDGKANEAVIEVLSDHFGLKKNKIRIISGVRSKDKLIRLG